MKFEEKELIVQILGICASTIAAIVLLWMLTKGIGNHKLISLLTFIMAWVSGIQCGEMFR